jgi:YebC/PmpR family DNA-binding regulatory protein
MSGHSKWATTKHQKGISDARRSVIFTKIQREIVVSVKMGDANPEFNPRLRNAIIMAKSENMPKDKIDAAIKRASSAAGGENYEEVRYEGYAPGSAALIVEALTDNRNRTASNVRSYFTKFGGTLGETGSVSYMFDRVGLIGYEGNRVKEDKIFELAIEAGAKDVESSEDWHSIITDIGDFIAVRDAVMPTLGEPNEAKIAWIPKNVIVVDSAENASKLSKLVEKLEDDDDVQNVTGNFEIPNNILENL